jgi:hypothetical protein
LLFISRVTLAVIPIVTVFICNVLLLFRATVWLRVLGLLLLIKPAAFLLAVVASGAFMAVVLRVRAVLVVRAV